MAVNLLSGFASMVLCFWSDSIHSRNSLYICNHSLLILGCLTGAQDELYLLLLPSLQHSYSALI